MAMIGIKIPFITDGRGSIETSNTLVNSIEDSIRQIIFTHKGERVMNEEFGCDLWKLVFDSDISIIKELATEYIKDSLLKFEPRIEIYSIDTNIINEIIYIEIVYKILNTNLELQAVSIQYGI